MRPHTPEWLLSSLKGSGNGLPSSHASPALFSYWRRKEISLPAHTMTNVIPNTRMAYLQRWKLKETSLSAPTPQWLSFPLKGRGDKFLRAHDVFGRKALDIDTVSIYLSVYLSVYLYQLSTYMNLYPYLCISVSLSPYLSISVSLYLSISLALYHSITLSLYLSIYLSVSLSIYTHIYDINM